MEEPRETIAGIRAVGVGSELMLNTPHPNIKHVRQCVRSAMGAFSILGLSGV